MSAPGTDNEVVTRTVKIRIFESGGFEVAEGGRTTGFLAWDEMLGVLAEITHPRIGGTRLGMMTPEEWDEGRRRRQERTTGRQETEKDQKP